jgi:hypothetical protein
VERELVYVSLPDGDFGIFAWNRIGFSTSSGFVGKDSIRWLGDS